MDIITNICAVVNDEATALKQVEASIRHNNEDYLELVKQIIALNGRLIFTGVGKSGHIGRKLAATFASMGTPAFFVHATEAMHGDLGMITPNDLVIAISNSGETKETTTVIAPIHRIGAKVAALTGNKNSLLARECDYLILVHVAREADQYNLAPTNSSTAALAVGDAIALTVAKAKGFSEKDFGMLHPGGSLGKRLVQEGVIK
ncbi:KpsF/GutQ family sugar-phosphate isomerase [Lactobacillus panisapium]|uniref:SIS domain-containing protein n=1 Tax=Lactobacillus panisapium TaxID=2012495 RepID=A0ABX8W4L9_9LACO|nr:SIS domain-containing protein [Lactobacillus panisapium]QYN52139.1 SIS domain-containing protein [Lactobacillus panisapium]